VPVPADFCRSIGCASNEATAKLSPQVTKNVILAVS